MSNVELVMSPEVPPLRWAAFRAQAPAFAVALDGYVGAGPRFDPAGPRANFNHHEEVDRLATHATCGQVLMAIRQGFFDTFRDAHGPRVVAHANDCDEDVCTSWWLLSRGYLAGAATNMLLNRLVAMEDALDATAGAYPYPADLPSLRALAWVFEPYRRFRAGGGLERLRADEYMGVVTDVGLRIDRHVAGGGDEAPLDTRFARIGGGPGWAMVDEVGLHARTGLFASGVRAFVAARPHAGGGAWTYTVGRMSAFVPFDVPRLLAALNEAEGLGAAATRRWGGGNTIGGSPRGVGSRLPPAEVERVVARVLGEARGG